MTNRTTDQQTSKLGLLAIPGAMVSLLPILPCALCWPAYAALISSLGLGFLRSSTYLLPLTAVLLAVLGEDYACGNRRDCLVLACCLLSRRMAL